MNTDRLFTDGVLVVDKPSGPTSHDVVAVTRRVLRRVGAAGASASKSSRGAPIKVGHTGTLDPLASGVLPLVLGIVQKQVIAREEAYLERAFGDEYVAYKNRVRRWL